mgnify:CR=1 FL=1
MKTAHVRPTGGRKIRFPDRPSQFLRPEGDRVNLDDFWRGRIADGMCADITIFDPAAVRDRATYLDPHQYPFGIPHVIVNGVPIIVNGALTGAKPGRVLKGPARRQGG